MRRVTLWQVEGRLHALDENGKRKPRSFDGRTVQFEATDFDDAAAHACDALLANWSRNPHEAEPIRLQPVLDKGGDSHIVYVRDTTEENP